MARHSPVVLLVEWDPDIRELDDLILTEAGYRVTTAPPGVDPVEFAAQASPDAIVVRIRPTERESWRILDSLQVSPRTARFRSSWSRRPSALPPPRRRRPMRATRSSRRSTSPPSKPPSAMP